tara:strand:+ start:541 stop:1044 length:504 start_codon:yes stop_codon:yes gene_type:complete
MNADTIETIYAMLHLLASVWTEVKGHRLNDVEAWTPTPSELHDIEQRLDQCHTTLVRILRTEERKQEGADEKLLAYLRGEEVEPAPRKHIYYVNVYQIQRAYGGPEEGGWWYDEGTPIESETTTEGGDLRGIIEKLEKSHGEICGSRRVVVEFEPGRTFPERKPVYC